MFLTGIGANYVRECAAEVPTTPDKSALDAELVLVMFTRVHPDYRHHLRGIKSGLVMWKEIRKFCVSSTLHSQILAWRQFTHVHHDIDRPIGVYLDSIDKAVRALEGFGYRPSDQFHMYTLLANLDPAFHRVRNEVYSTSPVPTLTVVKTKISSECTGTGDGEDDFPVKTEGANAARSGPYTSSYTPRAQAGGSFRSDDTRFRWCSPVHNDQCRRCGKSGHVADRCVYDMPQHVKDWVIAGAPKSGGSFQDVDGATAAAAQIAPSGDQATSTMSGRAIALEHAFTIVTAAQSGETLDAGVVDAAFKLIEANAAAYEEGRL
ncbi:hypothetical protein EV359DRAFT_88195 [Lentinula novae-zelandiae]|nr:hypothetical protein EV359DRAFT_88195 [Lentinula novae-zelandiae]